MIRILTRAEMMERRKALRDLAFAAFLVRISSQPYQPTAEDHAEAQRFGLVWNPEINDFDEPKQGDCQS